MQTGVLTQESLSQVLRGVSQRRRQGCLEVRYTDRVIRILFLQGKVVEFLEQGVNPAQEVLRALRQAELVELDFSTEASTYIELWSQLSVSQAASTKLNLSVFKEAIKHRILDKLYSLDVSSEAFFAFDAAMVEVEREYVPNISVGQLLLDLVALETEQTKFKELFEDDFLVVRQALETPAGLSFEELSVLDVLEEPLTAEQIKTYSLLSAFSLQESLMHLHSRDLISVAKPEPVLSANEFLDESLLKGLDASIDAAFEEESLPTNVQELQVQPDSISTSLEEANQLLPQAKRQAAWQQRLALLSSKMMHMYWIPAVVMALFILAAVLLPSVLWSSIWSTFDK